MSSLYPTCLVDLTASDSHPAITLATTLHSSHIWEWHIQQLECYDFSRSYVHKPPILRHISFAVFRPRGLNNQRCEIELHMHCSTICTVVSLAHNVQYLAIGAWWLEIGFLASVHRIVNPVFTEEKNRMFARSADKIVVCSR